MISRTFWLLLTRDEMGQVEITVDQVGFATKNEDLADSQRILAPSSYWSTARIGDRGVSG